MPEINLLQNQLKDTTLVARQRTQLVAAISAVVLILLIISGGGIYLLTKNTQEKVAKVIEDNDKILKQINEQDRYLSDAKSYQAKLSNIELLLKNHVAVAPLLDEFEKYTYQQARFISADVAQDLGKVHLEGVISTYEGLGKLLLGLSTSPNFKNVKLSTVTPSNQQNFNGYTFAIDLNVVPGLFSINNED
jgi:hypothetical protein